MNGERRRWTLLTLLLLIGGSRSLFLFWPRESLLLERATRVADLNDWEIHGQYWIDDRTALLFPRVLSNSTPVSTSDPQQFFRHDILSGVNTPLDAVPKLLGYPYFVESNISISPDSKRFCCLSLTNMGHSAVAWGATFEGKQPFGISDVNAYSLYWMSDNKHILRWRGMRDADGKIYDIQNQAMIRHVPIPDDVMENVDCVATNDHLFGVVERADRLKPPMADHIEIREAAIGIGIRLLHKYRLRFPSTCAFLNSRFSPQGDRIVLLLIQPSPTPPMYGWFRRKLPRIVPAHPVRISLWTSHLDGTQMKELGYVPFSLEGYMDGPIEPGILRSEPQNLDWTPDGKRVSFTYHDALYIVPVD